MQQSRADRQVEETDRQTEVGQTDRGREVDRWTGIEVGEQTDR